MREKQTDRLQHMVICTVTHNSAPHLVDWWRALKTLAADLSARNSDPAVALRVVAVDCASSDESVELLQGFQQGDAHNGLPLTVVASDHNLGFAGGMNRACAELTEQDQWVLALNPDARPTPQSVSAMLAAFECYRPVEQDSEIPFRVGSVTPRLLRPSEPSSSPSVLDACGMAWTSSWRHLDRGSGQVADGRFTQAEEVVAGTGAALMLRVEALVDVALPSTEDHTTTGNLQDDDVRSGGDTSVAGAQYFDEDFHSFREDAELGLRLQRRGWSCIYEPRAVVEHRRLNLPERRRQMSPLVNYHSLKNRYLLRILHQHPGNALRTVPALLRDVAILGYVLLRERSSLPAYSWLLANRQRLLRRRRWLQQQQSVPTSRVDFWFRHASRALNKPASGTKTPHRRSTSLSRRIP